MLKRIAGLTALGVMVVAGLSAQGLNTNASKDDWEEINFDFNSSVLVDGFPSMLRLSELLQKNPGYKVKVEGHTDLVGGNQYNDKLGMARANTVRDFLVKYGARPAQIEVSTRGKVDPKYPGQKPYSKTDEARWMNRRVVVTVMDDQGRTVSAAGVGDAIRAMEQPKPAAGMTDCCSEVLKRLDKLDDIARLLKDLADQNAALRRDLDALKQAQQVLESKANQPQVKPPSADEVAQAVTKEIEAKKEPKFQLLGVNVGIDQNGDVTATGRGRFFGTFADHYAVQAQGEYLYFKGQKEAQFDIGLVDRLGRFQASLFSSFKNVSLSGNQNSGTLGQANVNFDYLFKWGKVGIFGTYAFLDNSLINSQAAILSNGVTSPDLVNERFLRVVNQAGASFSAGLWGNNYVEGNIGYLKSAVYGDRAGATMRFVFPLNNRLAFTVEGDLNPTMIGPSNDGRAVVGVIFGNSLRPKEFLGQERPVPVDVPRVRWEQVSKQILKGHTAPVANAGPDQIGVPAGPITLNASASYSPDGLPITFHWVQDSGPTVTLTSPNSAITSFPATAAQSYIFRVVVTDSLGGQGMARVHVTTASAGNVAIDFFIANPTNITAGQASTLSWKTENATTVTVSGVSGNLATTGSASVSPTVTTTYTLTASNPNSSQSATATVTVMGSTTNVVSCYASPSNIILGESATLFYTTTNANSVTVNPGGLTEGANGSVVVTPTGSTTYTIMANGPNNATATCSAAVTVTNGQLPRIIQFSSSPQTITAGQSSTLLWNVENANQVSISPGLGNVSLAGTQAVSPAGNTTYILTATNAAGSVTAQATVNVGVGVSITSFTANPNPSPSAGAPVVLSCQATGAASITLNGTLTNGLTATQTVNPQVTTPYTCIATGSSGQTVQQTLTVVVGTTTSGNSNPVIVIKGGNVITTNQRNLTFDASGSYSPSGNNPLTFTWVALNDRSLIFNAASPVVNVQVGLIPGQYLFRLTVTDSKGNSSSTIVTVNWSI